jgi:hypothetical protein
MRSTKLLRIVVLMVTVCAFALSAQVGYILNGSFSVGIPPYGDPQDWSAGELDALTGLWRDTEDYNSAPASLGVMRVDTGNGGSYNQAFQNTSKLPASPGGSYTWEAMVRVDSTSGGSFQLVNHYSGSQYWQEISGGWVTLHMFNAPTSGWQLYSGTVNVPAGAVWGLFRIWSNGIIAYHIDDIKINGEDEVVSVQRFERAPNLQFKRLDYAGELKVFRPDGRAIAVGATDRTGVRQMVPGCYLVSRQGVTEKLLAR